MAWVAVDKIGEELISRTEPFRVGDYLKSSTRMRSIYVGYMTE